MGSTSGPAARERRLLTLALGGACLLLFSGSRPADGWVPIAPLVVESDVLMLGHDALPMTAFFPNPSPQVQAVGLAHQRDDVRSTDRQGSLRNATALSSAVPGVRVLSPGRGTHYGTYELVELIQQVGTSFEQRHPGRALRIGDLSRRRGGTIRDASGARVHSSHRNGLDADVMYLNRDCNERGSFDDAICGVDLEASLELMASFVAGGPEGEESLVDLFYVGDNFRDRTCRLVAQDPSAAERYAPVLERLQVMGGHESHFHVRIRCPETSLRCPAPRKHRPRFCPRRYGRR